ncbi:nitroreductase [Catellatospora sp. KI3]|uniref:Acg family FMN-binding oxidoreductase n=1 Tax=Catellatospora sp. KI3 TaxID=3041620 RepID=UPI002482E601|nr:nitroreductase family protein [Catellatospora sp. KI3]MDI1464787.1 nitroreductase [Catellatospora sp. KI3]
MQTTQNTEEKALQRAVRAALAAPSIFNTQPWRWRIDGPRARLYADRSRQLLVADPDGRLMTVSCGAALHHGRVALADAGEACDIARMPDPTEPDLLATIRVTGPHEPTLAEMQAAAAINRRRTDRRPFTAQPVGDAICRTLIVAAESEHAHALVVDDSHIAVLGLIAVEAGALQLSDAYYRAELADWTHRPPWSGDGVDTAGAVPAAPRRVPVRDYAPFGGPVMHPGWENDRGARYLLVYTDGDTPVHWLRAGEALSALLLTAVATGLSTAPISDVTELPTTRDQLRTLLPGIGHPQIAVRVGYGPPGEPPPSTTRRLAEEVINPR